MDDRCNIILQDFHVATFIQNHFVDGFQDDALQGSLIVLTPQAMPVFCRQLSQQRRDYQIKFITMTKI